MTLTKQNGGLFSFGDKLKSPDEIRRIKKINRTTKQEKKICKIDHEGDPQGYKRCLENLATKRALDIEESDELGRVEKVKKTFLKKEIKKCKIRHSDNRRERKECIRNATQTAEKDLHDKEYNIKHKHDVKEEGDKGGEDGDFQQQAEQQREEREREIRENNEKIKQGNKYEDEYEYPNFLALFFNLMEYGGKKYFDLMIKLNLAILGMFFGKLTENMNKGEFDIDAIFKNPEMKKLINQFVKVFAEMFGKILEASGDQLVKIAPVFMNSAYKISFKTTTNIGMAMVSAVRAVLSTIPFVGTFISILFIIQGAINAGTTITLNFLRMITKLSTAMVKVTGKTEGPLVKVFQASNNLLKGVSNISKSVSNKTTEAQNKQLDNVDEQEKELLKKSKDHKEEEEEEEEEEEKEEKEKPKTKSGIMESIISKLPKLRKNIEDLLPVIKEQLSQMPSLKKKILIDLRENNIDVRHLLNLTPNKKLKDFFKKLLKKPDNDQKKYLEKIITGGGKKTRRNIKKNKKTKKKYDKLRNSNKMRRKNKARTHNKMQIHNKTKKNIKSRNKYMTRRLRNGNKYYRTRKN